MCFSGFEHNEPHEIVNDAKIERIVPLEILLNAASVILLILFLREKSIAR